MQIFLFPLCLLGALQTLIKSPGNWNAQPKGRGRGQSSDTSAAGVQRCCCSTEATNISVTLQARGDGGKPPVLERRLKQCFYFSFTAGLVVHHQGWPQDTSGCEIVPCLVPSQCLHVYSSLEEAQIIPSWLGRQRNLACNTE